MPFFGSWPSWPRLGPARAGRKAANPAMPLLALHGSGEARWSSPERAALAREGFQRKPVVHRCVVMIAEAAASMPWLMYEGDREIVKHPALDLLRRPAPGRPGRAFLERLAGHLLLSGNGFVQAALLEGRPRELHLLQPERVRMVEGGDGWPTACEYGEGTRRQVFDLAADPPHVLHLAQFNPLDECRGMASLCAAHMALDIHNTASRWNKALLDNSARPSGALVYNAPDAANLTADQFARLKSELEEGYAGSERAGRPMLLEGGLDWKAMGFSPRDMDFIEAKNGAARDIALAYGVPPMLLGIPGDLTHANYHEANRALWRQTVLPFSARLAEGLGTWLAAHFDEDFRLELDRDGVEALAGDRESLWKRLNEASFLDEDERREAAGYEPRRR